MKILFVQKEGGIFGAENYQLKVIPGLLAKGVEVEFLRLFTDYQGGEGGDFIDRLNALGVKTYEINIGKYPSLKVLRKLHEIAKQSNSDLIHSHLIHADFHMALTKLLFRGKYTLISTKHGYDNAFTSKFGFDASKQKKTPYFLISRWAEKRMKASFTISNGLRDFFLATGLSTANRMGLIHYGFDLPNHYLEKGNSKYRLASKQLIIAGRLVSFKGHEYLLNAMPKLVERFGSEVKLLIAGTGDLEEQLKNKVGSMQLNEHVEFLGYSKEVGNYMANSDVVVIPSISEGFGVVFLEAFAAKTPVVSWDVPAGNELMENGISGHLVSPYDIEKLSEKLIDVLSQNQEHIVQKAYTSLTGYYTLERMVNQTINFYKKVLA